LSQLRLPLEAPADPARDEAIIAPCNAEAVAFLDAWPIAVSHAALLIGPRGTGKSLLVRRFLNRYDATLLAEPQLSALPTQSIAIDSLTPGFDEAALFHLYNATREAGLKLLMIAREDPARWRLVLADLRSRLAATPRLRLGEPDDALLPPLLLKLFRLRGLKLEPCVLDYLTPRVERRAGWLIDLVKALDDAALEQRRNVSVPLARDVLARFFKSDPLL
jgi:chromosomal replication initiation ATPase DnaA